jgi:hypothetical protein
MHASHEVKAEHAARIRLQSGIYLMQLAMPGSGRPYQGQREEIKLARPSEHGLSKGLCVAASATAGPS